jgi:phage gp46-like protein
MSERIDIKLNVPTDFTLEKFDISIDESGDITADDSFDTSIFASLYSDGRADASQIAPPENGRRWNGDANTTLEVYLFGSKLWLLDQERLTQPTVNKARDYAQASLQWIIDLGFATRIDVRAKRNFNSQIELNIEIYVERDIVKSFTTVLWLNSDYTAGRTTSGTVTAQLLRNFGDDFNNDFAI